MKNIISLSLLGLNAFFMLALVIHGQQAQAQNLMSHVTVDVTDATYSYTLFNDEPSSSTNYDGYFTLFVESPFAVVGTPDGWTYTVSDNNDGFVNWYNTDPALPYPHDVAPGASLSGFIIKALAPSSSQLSSYEISAWDHAADSSGPLTTGTILAPAPVPEASTPISFVALLTLGGIGLAARKRTRRKA